LNLIKKNCPTKSPGEGEASDLEKGLTKKPSPKQGSHVCSGEPVLKFVGLVLSRAEASRKEQDICRALESKIDVLTEAPAQGNAGGTRGGQQRRKKGRPLDAAHMFQQRNCLPKDFGGTGEKGEPAFQRRECRNGERFFVLGRKIFQSARGAGGVAWEKKTRSGKRKTPTGGGLLGVRQGLWEVATVGVLQVSRLIKETTIFLPRRGKRRKTANQGCF